ncbi:MAG TPA: alpha/beta hydrolase [Gemmatimonadaceae bacterium]
MSGRARRFGIVGGLVAFVLIATGAFYFARNPERETLDDAARVGKPGKFVRLSDGVTHYDVAGPDSGRVVVLVHGMSVPYYIWDSTFAALANAGYRVVRYDEYGRGLSDRPDTKYNDDLYDRQLAQLLDSLHVSERVDLGGVSMGGAVTAMYAGRHPKRVRSLMLVDPVAGTGGTQGKFGWPVIGPYLWQMLVVPTMAEGQTSDFVEPARFPDWVDRYREQMRYRGFGRALLSHRKSRVGISMDTVYQRVARDSVPVLLLWGKEDQTVPFAMSASVRAAIPSAEFHAIDGAAHLPILERAPVSDSLMLAFLSRIPR